MELAVPSAVEAAPARSESSGEVPVVLVARGLTRTYRMGEVLVYALRGVDFELRRGEFVVLLGASGSGKSTLLNLLGGLDVPTSGSIRWRDHDLTKAD